MQLHRASGSRSRSHRAPLTAAEHAALLRLRRLDCSACLGPSQHQIDEGLLKNIRLEATNLVHSIFGSHFTVGNYCLSV